MTRAVGLVAVLCLASSGLVYGAASQSFEDLIANLKSPNVKTRQEAARELGKSRRREAVAPLAALVRDPEAKVRIEVVRALRALRSLDTVPALVTSLEDGAPEIREEALGSLVELYTDRERSTAIDRFLAIFSDEDERAGVSPLTRVDPSVFEGLAKLLGDEDRRLRREAALALGILGGRPAMDGLVQALQDPEPSVREAAATAIGKVGTTEDGKALIPLLADESEAVQSRVLRAIGTLRVKEAGPALVEMYEGARRRKWAMRTLEALSRIRDPNQEGLFRTLVQDPDPERRRLAIEGLARVADQGLLPAFKKDFQRERNAELRLAYAFALTLLGDQAFVDTIVLSLPSGTLRTRCWGYLLEMGPEIVPSLLPYLSDPDANIRVELCQILRALGDPSAIPHLTPLINDPNGEVADYANRTVQHLRALESRSQGQ
jgi:HEAT repeat protein